jgi:hypothetical protein
MAYLPEKVSLSITHLMDDVDHSAEDSYEKLKGALTQGFTNCKWEMAFELFSLPSIGNMKLTKAMRHMLNLMPDSDGTGTLFMALFLLRLPTDIRELIVAKEFTDCHEMAENTDWIHFGRKSTSVAAVTGFQAVNAVKGQRWTQSPREQHRLSPSHQGQSRRQTPGPRCNGGDFRYFHATYRNRAKKCKPGCMWQPEN